MLEKYRLARASLVGAILLVGLLGSAAQSTPSVGAESTGQLISREPTGPVTSARRQPAPARRLNVVDVAPLPLPASESFPSSTLMAYDMFGVPYRSNGAMSGSVLVGAPPFGRHELVPQRMNSSWSWYEGVLPGGSASWDGRFYSPWGQIFIGQGNTAKNVRLQVRNAKTLYLDSGNVWRNLRGDVSNWKMEGTYYNNTFNGAGISSSVRDESANGGGWSVSLAPLVNDTNAMTWHWWLNGYYPRTPVPVGTKALFQAVQMRLITEGDDPAADSTRFIASWSADNYSGATATGSGITAFGQPRMKRIRSEWVWVTSHYFREWYTSGVFGPSNILANPPTEWPT